MFSGQPFGNSGTTVSEIAAGAAIAAYSFLGFDAITTLTEETQEPRRTIPKAIVLVTVIGGIIFFVASYATQLVAVHVHSTDPNSTAFDIAAAIGGRLMSSVFLAGLVITQFASGVAAQASASRLLFAMGRDNVLPRRVFGYLQRKFRTPVINIGLVGLVGVAAVKLDPAKSVSFINFGAFTAFTSVNLCVIAMAIRRRAPGQDGWRNTLRGPRGVLVNLVVPLIGAGIDVWLLTNLDSTAIRLGLSWLAIGVVYLAYLTRGFRRPPPEMDFAEEEPELASA